VPHPLDGIFSADHSARLLRNYRYVVERAMRALGCWIALTPELSAKLLLGRHVWDLAQHCDAFGRRLPELRAHAQVSEAANPAVAAFMDSLEEPEGRDQTVERLVGVYSVLKPHLLATYRGHLAQANAVYEPPTRRILTRCIEDEERHIAEGDTTLRHLLRETSARERAASRQRRLEELLVAARGVTGDDLVPLTTPEVDPSGADLSGAAREFIRLETATTTWAIPEGLGNALRSFADALLTADEASLGRWLATGLTPGATASDVMRGVRYSGHRIVAFARLGNQRLVKMRLEGPTGSAVVLTRWASTPEGWRAAALDVVDTMQSARPVRR
jgi:hypothetical protein